MLIGKNALNGKDVFLTDDDRKEHMHIIGGTGAGKSKLMEWMIRQDIKEGKGLCLIDPRGDLYKNILKYVVCKRLEKDVIIIDPNDEKWAVGLNYLEYDPEIRSSTSHASDVMNGIAKVFGWEETDSMPRLQKYERGALIPLIEKQLTLIELSDFVDPVNATLRALILREVQNYQVIQRWERFDKTNPRDRAAYVEPIESRADKFATGEIVRRMFGQVKSTINFRQMMDEGKIILCNLGCGKISEEEQKMLGVVIIDKIVQAGMSRTNIPEQRRRPFYVYIDEFGDYVSRDIAKALTQLRKYQVRFILAHQELEQLREDDRKVYSAVMAEPGVRVSFRTGREDAEILAKEMFTGVIRGDKVKHKIEQTKFRPVETTRIIKGRSEGHSESTSESESNSSISSISEGETVRPTFDFLGEDQVVFNTTTTGSVSASGSSSGTSSGYTESTSETAVPFYEYDEFKEISSIQYYSIEEIMEKYISWIKNQPNRRCQIKIQQKRTIPMITPFVKDVSVRLKDVEALKETSYSRYALPSQEVDTMIEQRRKDFLAEAEKLEMIESGNPQNTEVIDIADIAEKAQLPRKPSKKKA